MKEISIEEKAQRYDEAMKAAVVAHKDKDRHLKATLERIFPELAESEDEKIRKWLIHYFKEACDNVSEKEKKGVLAWLEKQDHTDRIIERAKTEKQRVIITETDGNANIDWDTRSLKDAKKLLERGLQYIDAELEKQGEQKSIKTCAEYYNKDRELKMPVLSEFQDKLADILMHREYDGPDETEDDIAKGRLEYELAAIRLSEELLPLAQKEQKPAEWSEEDELIVAKILCICNDFERSFESSPSSMKVIKEDVDKIDNWLKSLRPQKQWKPSDEQIKAVKEAACYSSVFSEKTIDNLISLSKQLKTLREE